MLKGQDRQPRRDGDGLKWHEYCFTQWDAEFFFPEFLRRWGGSLASARSRELYSFVTGRRTL